MRLVVTLLKADDEGHPADRAAEDVHGEQHQSEIEPVTGPAGNDPRGSDIAGTGTAGGSLDRTDGGFDTSPLPATGAEEAAE